jgi:hypothetical protein
MKVGASYNDFDASRKLLFCKCPDFSYSKEDYKVYQKFCYFFLNYFCIDCELDTVNRDYIFMIIFVQSKDDTLIKNIFLEVSLSRYIFVRLRLLLDHFPYIFEKKTKIFLVLKNFTLFKSINYYK